MVNEKYLNNIYTKYGELHNPIIRKGRIVGRWGIREEKIDYVLYEKIKNRKELNKKVKEMEEFFKN